MRILQTNSPQYRAGGTGSRDVDGQVEIPASAPLGKPMPRVLSLALAACALCAPASRAHAQISLNTAVDLALTNNPRIKMAQADAARAQAALSESKDVYIPSLNAGAGLGQAYGYSPNPPTLFNFTAGSLVYGASQFSYIRSAHAGLSAAQLALEDVREAVAEDAALTFVALDKDQRREQALNQQSNDAEKLVEIVSDRFDAGQDTRIDLTQAKLTAAQIRLNTLHAHDDTANDTAHLQRIMGIPAGPLQVAGGFPATPFPADIASQQQGALANASVASAFASARAKLQQANGDSRFLYRPQISLVIQYSRYATFTNAFISLQNEYKNPTTGNTTIGANEEVIGVQIGLPLFDKARKAKARETAAEAVHSLQEAENAQITVLDAQTRLSHTITELQARAEVATLQEQLAQQQLDIVDFQLTHPNPGTPPMTPKDQQNQRIGERDKYLDLVETNFELQQAEISLLRQTGRLREWLHQAALTQSPSVSSPAQPHP
jgi:outer membrane protein TolC